MLPIFPDRAVQWPTLDCGWRGTSVFGGFLSADNKHPGSVWTAQVQGDGLRLLLRTGGHISIPLNGIRSGWAVGGDRLTSLEPSKTHQIKYQKHHQVLLRTW